ncbi:ABC transporter substrate-binding protein [Desulforamulus aeronauticus]|uniref:Peptide/nickel transport system substrate-binding protein n=1 Tax=Desulforamulus aeronauticus DSM 10349 TaxID=1121421 RepID=A0A1M6VGZ2_9FIRM|nr:ABC transporter substrate-binding protein [Desulforamulus aeronauticus]SHK80817.1 peptide/nickel transport system substrate-binding protein [Desulforamulus aeronauticus DSM 10349]
MLRKRSILLLMLVSLLALALVGCGGDKEKAAQTAKPKVFVFGQGADPRGLDPAFVDDGESANPIVNIYDGLVRYKTGSTEIEPALATEWSPSADGKEWTFKLRQGVKFHDGTPFNADAVVFSVSRQLPPQRTDAMPYASFTFGPVEKVEKVDDYTVKFVLSEPYAPFLANLAMALAAPIVSPAAVEKYGDKFIENPVGTGPFKFVQWKKGEQIVLEANKEYWDGAPKLDKLVYKFIKENSVRASELRTGSIQAMNGLDPNDVKMLEDAGLSVIKNPGMNINYLGFFCNKKPFNDPKLRLAVSHAINRENLINFLYQGLAELPNSVLPSFMPGHDKSLQAPEYNPEKAKQLLAEAGYANGLKVTLLTYSNVRPYNPVGGDKLAAAIQADLRKVGIEAEIKTYPWKEYKEIYTPEIVEAGDFMLYGWIGDNGDPDNFLSLLETKEIKSTLNAAKYSNKKVDELLVKARTAQKQEERNAAYSELQKIVQDEAPWVFLGHSKDMAAVSKNVEGFDLHPVGVIYFHNVDIK